MIKNDRQYRITKAAATKFEEALKQLESSPSAADPSVHPMIQKAERDAVHSQLEDLRAQLDEYEILSTGKSGIIEAASLADLPTALIHARIASGFSQKDLGGLLNMKEQQVQRYEATDYQQASLSRLLEIAKVLNVKVRQEMTPTHAIKSSPQLFTRLKDIGLTKEFVLNRLVPAQRSPLSSTTLRMQSVASPMIYLEPHRIFSIGTVKQFWAQDSPG